MKTLTIDRAKWRTAEEGEGDTMLRNEEGYMCCLGFFCEQAGLKKLNRGEPAELESHYKQSTLSKKIPEMIEEGLTFLRNSKLACQAIDINDHPDMSNEQREEELTKLFAKHNIKVKFRGRYGA